MHIEQASLVYSIHLILVSELMSLEPCSALPRGAWVTNGRIRFYLGRFYQIEDPNAIRGLDADVSKIG